MYQNFKVIVSFCKVIVKINLSTNNPYQSMFDFCETSFNVFDKEFEISSRNKLRSKKNYKAPFPLSDTLTFDLFRNLV